MMGGGSDGAAAAMQGAPRLRLVDMATGGASWRGTLAVGMFPRLREALGEVEAADGQVDVTLRFGLERGRVRVRGDCRFVARISCTRCLEQKNAQVVAELDFHVVRSEAEAQALTPALDVVVAREQALATELIEDDLLMSLPEVACADRNACPNAPQAQGFGRDASTPFAALQALKQAGASEQS